MNAMLIISGAFGLFHKPTVLKVGGYRTETIGEDMELVVRLHRLLRESKTPYRITFVPDPICWTEAPEDLRTLRNQRIRWQRGLCESLSLNRELLLHPTGGMVGWIAFPFAMFFECLSPVMIAIGYFTIVVCFGLGLISGAAVRRFCWPTWTWYGGLGQRLTAGRDVVSYLSQTGSHALPLRSSACGKCRLSTIEFHVAAHRAWCAGCRGKKRVGAI